MVNHLKMVSESSPIVRRCLFPSSNEISKEQFELFNAWNELAHYRRWCKRDNPQTWVQFASHFNSSSTGTRSITLQKVKCIWLKIEESVRKFEAYYHEVKMYSLYTKDFDPVAIKNNCL